MLIKVISVWLKQRCVQQSCCAFWLSRKIVQPPPPLHFLSLNMWQLGMSHWTALIKTSNWSQWTGMLTSKTYMHLIWGRKKNISIQVKNVCYVKCISCAERLHSFCFGGATVFKLHAILSIAWISVVCRRAECWKVKWSVLWNYTWLDEWMLCIF